ncbi:MAG: carboxypeptidase-like regulatory domain-containing protein, partial [Pseudomonadota bacterium]
MKSKIASGRESCSHVVVLCALSSLLGRCTCAPEEPPPLTPTAVGTIVGEAYVEDPTQRSLGGTVVEVYGMSARAVSQEGMQFVLQPIPLGEHTLLLTHPDLDRSIRIKAKVEAPYQTVLLPASATTLKSAASLTGTVTVSGGTAVGAIAFLVGGNSQQQSAVGDDGSFVLSMLPPGAGAKIAVAKNGYEVAMASIDLSEGINALPSAVALSPTSAGNLTLRGKVVLDGLTDQRGTMVLLNGGAEVASTDQDGVYQFTALGPGLFSLKAQHPGYRSVELPQVALTTGGAQGLVDMFLAPGSDLDDGSGQDQPVVVSLRNPLPGQTLQGGAPVVLAADVGGRIVDANDVVWHVREVGETGPGTELGRGFIVTGSLPLVSQRTVMEILVSVVGAGVTLAQDHVLVYVDRLLQDAVEVAHRTGYGIQPAVIEEVLDAQGNVERVRYRIQQGQPIELSDPRGQLGERMVFTCPSGPTFFGTARLGELEVGTYVYDVAVTDDSGLISHATVEVIVSPLQFTITLLSPIENPSAPYYAYQGLPASVTVQHGFQTYFPQQSVSWRDTVGRPVANGLSATIRSLPAGDGVISVEVGDVAGNTRLASVAYRLEDVEFTATFNAPTSGMTVRASEALTVNVGYTHTYQPPIDPATLRVSLHSNRQANLRPDGASTSTFQVNQDVNFSSLVPGVHTLTARIFDGSRYAEATR